MVLAFGSLLCVVQSVHVTKGGPVKPFLVTFRHGWVQGCQVVIRRKFGRPRFLLFGEGCTTVSENEATAEMRSEMRNREGPLIPSCTTTPSFLDLIVLLDKQKALIEESIHYLPLFGEIL